MSAVCVRGFEGIACRDLGPAIVTYDDEREEVEDPDRRRVRMVGDDHVFIVDASDVTPLEGDSYCIECGQIGCCQNVRSEDS